MAVLFEPTYPLAATRKTRHTDSLVRHASAPARSQLALSHSTAREEQERRNKISSPLSPRHSAGASTVSSRLLRQLSVAQVIESQPKASERVVLEQQHTNARLEAQYAVLREELQASVAINNKMLGRLQTSVLGQERLVGQVKDLERGMARLKKSDRAKGKVWQRNLRLKATLHQYAQRTDFNSSPSDANTTEALQEALAIATERVQELETKGQALLDALEGCDNKGEDQDEDEDAAKVLETTIAFRGVLEDETCKALKEHWHELLED